MDAPEPVRALMETLLAARAAGDGAAIAALYVDDGSLFVPAGQRIQGRAAIAAYYQTQAQAARKQQAPKLSPPKFYFFPPLVHAVSSANGRHGEKHSFIDILLQQDGGGWLLACSSWTLR
ncbi:MAG: hypothetical protein JWP59_982 [Massilia sp.]|jgi:ketosteroid isomerase-like protein|nr:hypothetical protein [Massilia sp.]